MGGTCVVIDECSTSYNADGIPGVLTASIAGGNCVAIGAFFEIGG